MITILLNALLLVAVAPVSTATTPPAATAPAAEAPRKERQICKREHVSGSLHGSKRVCMTAREWRARNGGGLEDLSDVSTR